MGKFWSLGPGGSEGGGKDTGQKSWSLRNWQFCGKTKITLGVRPGFHPASASGRLCELVSPLASLSLGAELSGSPAFPSRHPIRLPGSQGEGTGMSDGCDYGERQKSDRFQASTPSIRIVYSPPCFSDPRSPPGYPGPSWIT